MSQLKTAPMGKVQNLSLQSKVIPKKSVIEFSTEVKVELLNLINAPYHDNFLQDAKISDSLLDQISTIKKLIANPPYFALLVKIDGVDTFDLHKKYTSLIGRLLGQPMVQNSNCDLMIEVYNRGESTIENGARYHQTKQGSYIHNDGVSYRNPIDYLLLSCVNSAYSGGESILVDIETVELELRNYPDTLKTLCQEFWFEKRGMGENDECFQAPIISYLENGKPVIRYFRAYIEAAYDKVGEKLSHKQIIALDCLDSIIDQISVQYRILLSTGQILISSDQHFLHSRTLFADKHESTSTDRGATKLTDFNRFMLRMWVKDNDA